MSTIETLYRTFLEYPEISTDTRDIKSNSLFFGLKGANFNGNTFAKKALEAGAKFAIIDEKVYKLNDNYILVKDVLNTLQELASFHRKHLNIPVIGITGSNGKTTSKELIAAVLKKKYKTYSTKGNLNNHIGVPLSLLSITSDIEIAVIEMGANHQGEIALLCNIAQPNYGIITNIGKAHLEGFGGIEGIKKGKGELYNYLKTNKGKAFVYTNSEDLMQMSSSLSRITYGNSEKADFQGNIISSDHLVEFNFNTRNTTTKVKSNLIGNYNISNLIAACCIGEYFKVDSDKIRDAIEEYFPTNNRSQIVKLTDKTLILDAYNANPSSMEAAITNFNSMPLNSKVLILGDMLELGEESDKEHQKISNLLDQLNLNNVFLVGKIFKRTNNNYQKFESSEELIDHLNSINLQNTSILIKGSRGIKLEEVANFFQIKKEA